MYKDLDYRLNTANKDIILSEDIEAIRNSLRNIVTTKKFTVPGKPEFGSNIYDVLFEQNDELTYSLLEEMLIEDIEEQETRIIIQNINVTSIDDQIIVIISYSLVNETEINTISIKI